MLDSEGIAGKGLLKKESIVELLKFLEMPVDVLLYPMVTSCN